MLLLPKIGPNQTNRNFDHGLINEHIALNHPGHTESVNKFKDLSNSDKLEENKNHDLGGIEAKTVLKDKTTPKNRYILKDFNYAGNGGWNEMATKSLYHAGNLHHLIQDVHVIQHPTDETEENRNETGLNIKYPIYNHPYVNIAISHDHIPIAENRGLKVTTAPHDRAVAFNQIAAMDYLTHNLDRHGYNLMFHNVTGMPLAIDHGISLETYGKQPDFGDYYNKGKNFGIRKGISTPESFHSTSDWWLKNRNNLMSDFTQFVGKTVKDPKLAQTHLDRFKERWNKMDQFQSRAYQNIPYIKQSLYENR